MNPQSKLKDILQEKVSGLTVINGEAATQEINGREALPDGVIDLTAARQKLAALQTFVKEMMIPEIDYGTIPNCKKPSLYKSGAEKLCDIFGFAKLFEVTGRVEDWEKKIFHYEVKATLLNKHNGVIEAEGLGSCNSREKKYAYQDGCNITNTILKMAKKRAFVDAVLSATRSSGIFTQDMEDIQPPMRNPHPNQEPLVTREKTKEIMAVAKRRSLDMNFVKSQMLERYRVSESRRLTNTQADDFIRFLENFEEGKK